MSNHVAGKSIVITGAGGGFGRLVSQKTAALGARLTCADIDAAAAEETVAAIRAAGGSARAVRTDVSDLAQMKALAREAAEAWGTVDVMINNAGIMPLAFYADHEAAADAWHRCIDINFKGVLNGIIAVHDLPEIMSRKDVHVDFECKVFEVCNPHQAKKVLAAAPAFSAACCSSPPPLASSAR